MTEKQQRNYERLLAEGRTEDAERYLVLTGGQSTRIEPVQVGEKGDLLRRGQEIGLDKNDLFSYEGESQGAAFAADVDYQLENIPAAIGSLGANVLDPIFGHGDRANEMIREREDEYSQYGPGDRMTGGRLVGGLIGAGGLGSGAAKILGGTAARILGTGLAESLLEPVYVGEDDNYWAERAKQSALETGIGALPEVGLRGGLRAGEEALYMPGRTYNSLQEPASGHSIARGPADQQARVAEVEAETGVRFTPGQRSQSPAVLQAEELARQNIFTSSRVQNADAVRAQDLDDYVTRYRDSLGDADQVTVNNKLAAWGEQEADALIEGRAARAKEAYRPVREYANGQTVIEADNYENFLHEVISEGSTKGASGDARKAAAIARQRMERLQEGGIETHPNYGKISGRDVDMMTRTGEMGSVWDSKNVSFDERLNARMKEAVEADARAHDPMLAEVLEGAKRQYAKDSDKITSFETSLLGKQVGRELVSDVEGVVNGQTSFQTLYKKMTTADPTQIEYTMKYIADKDPEMARQFQSAILGRAQTAARQRAATAGLESEFDPGAFLRELGVKSGNRGLEGVERLSALFPNQPEVVNAMTDAARILADATQRNTSRSGITTMNVGAVKDAMNTATALLTGALTMAARTGGQILGSAGFFQRVSKTMDPDSGRYHQASRRREVPRQPIIGASPYATQAAQQTQRDNE